MPYQIQLYNAEPSYSIICYISNVSPLDGNGKTINYIELHRVLYVHRRQLRIVIEIVNLSRNIPYISYSIYIHKMACTEEYTSEMVYFGAI